MEEQRYLYHINIGKRWLAVGFFIICGLFLANVAQNTDRGLIIDGLIRLNIQQARLFYWGMTAVSVGIALYGVFGIIVAPQGPRYVRLTADSIVAPKSYASPADVKISYDRIAKLEMQEVNKQRFLVIFHAGGKLNIAQATMPSKARFEELCHALAARVQAARTPVPDSRLRL